MIWANKTSQKSWIIDMKWNQSSSVVEGFENPYNCADLWNEFNAFNVCGYMVFVCLGFLANLFLTRQLVMTFDENFFNF